MERAELRFIAENQLEDLRELPDGTEVTTAQLLERYGYNPKDFPQMIGKDIMSIFFVLPRQITSFWIG